MARNVKVYVHAGKAMAFWQTPRVGSNSMKGHLKRSGFKPGTPDDDWLHVALVRDPYERYISGLWIAATSRQRGLAHQLDKDQDWQDFLAEVEARNLAGDFYTWDGDQHLVPQVDFRSGMVDPVLVPLERVDVLERRMGAPRPITHVNSTDGFVKAMGREILSREPVIEHYSMDWITYANVCSDWESGRPEAGPFAGIAP